MRPAHNYVAEYRLGTMATGNAQCPYPVSQIGRRCAWLAGYHDARSEYA